MGEAPSDGQATLGDLLSAAARAASDAQLVAMAVVGVGGAVAIEWLYGRIAWIGVAAALTVGAYGCWGMADRELLEQYAAPGASVRVVTLLRVARAVAAVVATLAGVSALAVIFLPLLGLWRS